VTTPGSESVETPAQFKQALRQATRDAGFTDLIQLEHKSGLSHSTISAAFNPAKPLPSEKTVHVIATAANQATDKWLERRRSALHQEAVGAASSPASTSAAIEERPAEEWPPIPGFPDKFIKTISMRRWLLIGVAALVLSLSAVAISLFTTNDRNQLPTQTFTETTGTPAHTWSDYRQAGGSAGVPLGPRQSVQVSCRVRGYVVPDGDPWWYRLESSPWNGNFYATSDAFYNQGSVSGPVDNGVVVDEHVPVCK